MISRLSTFSKLKQCVVLPIIAALFVLTITSCRQNRIKYFNGSLIDAFQLAKGNNKRVFVLISDTACGKCKAFENFLDTQSETVEILNRDYICVKKTMQDKNDHLIIELLRNPSYPFPYFFEADGTLLTFGFPNSPEYNISNLDRISFDEYRFRALFNMDISTKQYKKLVSLNMKATLSLINQPVDLKTPYSLFLGSSEIYVYPYNLRYIRLLGRRIHVGDSIAEILQAKYRKVPMDEFLYGKIEEYRFIYDSNDRSVVSDKQRFNFDKLMFNMGILRLGGKYPFKFKITNSSNQPLIIENIDHPCDCVQFKWKSKTIGPGLSTEIEGTFKPYAKGKFSKEIFVYIKDQVPITAILHIQGTVNKSYISNLKI